jgi:hypothetical protein
MGLPPFVLALAGKTGPVAMITRVARNVNYESYGVLLLEFLFHPPPYSGERVERLLADMYAGQLVKAFEVVDHVAVVGGRRDLGDSKVLDKLALRHEFGVV